MNNYLMDQRVSKRKFEKDMINFESLKDEYENKGWEVLSNSFPLFVVELKFLYLNKMITFLKIEFDYTNYNILPLEVSILYPNDIAFNPFNTQKSYILDPNDSLLRIIYDSGKLNTLLTCHETTKSPFICMVGTNEYHCHTQHDKDYWDLYRYGGNGFLGNILNTIWSGSINAYKQYKDIVLIVNGKPTKVVHPLR